MRTREIAAHVTGPDYVPLADVGGKIQHDALRSVTHAKFWDRFLHYLDLGEDGKGKEDMRPNNGYEY